MRHFLVLSLLAATLITPLAVMGNDDHHRGERRYYDRDGRDYHYWNADEDRQYRAYLVEQHRAYVPFVKYRHRREYYRYRHEHGFRIEVR